MPYQVNTDSPIYQSLSPEQQKQVQDMAASGNIPPSVDQLYSTLANTKASTAQTTAAIPGTQANSQKAQIEAQQAGALKNLSTDLKQNKMTLPDAISKYKGLGMNPDDVFNQYLAQSPYGTPNQSPQELQRMGITAKALGDIGTPGSFMDRWNTKNAINGLRDLQSKFHQTNALSQLENKLGIPIASGNSAAAYNTAREAFGQHLATLIPGAPGAAGSIQQLMNTLPQTGDPREYNPGKADAQFNSLEDQLLKQKGYLYKDIGIAPATTQPSSNKGNDLLHTILGSAMNTAQDVGTGIRSKMEQGDLAKNDAMATQLEQQAQKTQDPQQKTALLASANQIRKGVSSESENIGKSFSPDINQNPLIRSILGATQVATAAEAPSLIKGAVAKAPGVTNSALSFLNPTRAISQTGAARDLITENATKQGVTVNGNNIVQGLQDWAKSGARGNLGQSKQINAAISDAQKAFGKQDLTPTELMQAYREADSGYTKGGAAKTAIQANIDRGLRQVIGSELEKAIPGWKELTTNMAKSYQTQKSPLRAGVKNIAKYSVPLGVGGAIGGAINGTLGHILFGE